MIVIRKWHCCNCFHTKHFSMSVNRETERHRKRQAALCSSAAYTLKLCLFLGLGRFHRSCKNTSEYHKQIQTNQRATTIFTLLCELQIVSIWPSFVDIHWLKSLSMAFPYTVFVPSSSFSFLPLWNAEKHFFNRQFIKQAIKQSARAIFRWIAELQIIAMVFNLQSFLTHNKTSNIALSETRDQSSYQFLNSAFDADNLLYSVFVNAHQSLTWMPSAFFQTDKFQTKTSYHSVFFARFLISMCLW